MEKSLETYYQRQIILPEVGKEGMEKLNSAKVLVVGAGGLGSTVLEQLCGSGVGNLGIVDSDTVSYSNLHRQSLYTEEEIGEYKVFCASRRLLKRNPHCKINVYPQSLHIKNAIQLIEPYDIVVDCTDNYSTRYLINDACVLLNKPFVYGAIYRFQGQVAVFNINEGPTYRCLNPEFPSAESATDCVNSGVMSVIPSLIGNFQALQTIKWILGRSDLSNDLLLIDFNQLNFHKMSLGNRRTDYNFLNGELTDSFYERDCPLYFELNVDEVKKLIIEGRIDKFVDVREEEEVKVYEDTNVKRYPLSGIRTLFPSDLHKGEVLFFCRSGVRCREAARIAHQKGNGTYYSLNGEMIPELIELWTNRK